MTISEIVANVKAKAPDDLLGAIQLLKEYIVANRQDLEASVLQLEMEIRGNKEAYETQHVINREDFEVSKNKNMLALLELLEKVQDPRSAKKPSTGRLTSLSWSKLRDEPALALRFGGMLLLVLLVMNYLLQFLQVELMPALLVGLIYTLGGILFLISLFSIGSSVYGKIMKVPKSLKQPQLDSIKKQKQRDRALNTYKKRYNKLKRAGFRRMRKQLGIGVLILGAMLTVMVLMWPSIENYIRNSRYERLAEFRTIDKKGQPFKIIFQNIREKGTASEQFDFIGQLERSFNDEKARYGLPIELIIEGAPESEIDSMVRVDQGVFVITGSYDQYIADLKVENRSSQVQNVENTLQLMGFKNVNREMINESIDKASEKIDQKIPVKPIRKTFNSLETTVFNLQYTIPSEIKYFVMQMMGQMMISKLTRENSKDLTLFPNPSLDALFSSSLAVLKIAERNLGYKINWLGFVPKPHERYSVSSLYNNLAVWHGAQSTYLTRDKDADNIISEKSIARAIKENQLSIDYHKKYKRRAPDLGELNQLRDLIIEASLGSKELMQAFLELSIKQNEHIRASLEVKQALGLTGQSPTTPKPRMIFKHKKDIEYWKRTTEDVRQEVDKFEETVTVFNVKMDELLNGVKGNQKNLWESFAIMTLKKNRKVSQTLEESVGKSREILKLNEALLSQLIGILNKNK